MGPNHVNAMASEAQLVLQMSRCNGKKKAWNQEMHVAQHFKYHIILKNLLEYGYQGLDPGSKVQYLLHSIRCDILPTLVAAVRALPDKYERVFDAVFACFMQYICKRAPTPSVKVASVARTDLQSSRRPALPMAFTKESLT